MTVTRDQFREGLTWEEWLEGLGPEADRWRERHDSASLGELRAAFQDVPTPRYVLCIADPGGLDSLETVPLIVRACERAGVAGGVDLRLLPPDLGQAVLGQYMTHGARSVPRCIVFDQDWLQVGVWGPRPRAAQDLAIRLEHEGVGGPELARRLRAWYAGDHGRSTLREFLTALRGQPAPAWEADHRLARHRRKQAERAREQP